jgi:hypothetical protein
LQTGGGVTLSPLINYRENRKKKKIMNDLNIQFELWQRLAKEKEIDVNISPKTLGAGLKLLTRFAPKVQMKTFDFIKLIKKDSAEAFFKVAVVLGEEFNEEKNEYSQIGKDVFNFLAKVFKTDKNLEEIQLFELLEIAENYGNKVKEYMTRLEAEAKEREKAENPNSEEVEPDFLEPTTSENTTESLPTTETE